MKKVILITLLFAIGCSKEPKQTFCWDCYKTEYWDGGNNVTPAGSYCDKSQRWIDDYCARNTGTGVRLEGSRAVQTQYFVSCNRVK